MLHKLHCILTCFQAECSSFIETLFTVIRTKSYLPYQAVPQSPSFPDKPLDNGIPIPLDALLTATSASPDRTRKRSTTDDERDGRPPAKGPRLNNGSQFSRYGTNGGDDRMGPHSSGGWTRPPFRDGGMGMGMGMAPFGVPMPGMQMNGMAMMNGRRPQGYQPPDQKRGLCRDYHRESLFLCTLYAYSTLYYRKWVLRTRPDVQIQPRRRRRGTRPTLPRQCHAIYAAVSNQRRRNAFYAGCCIRSSRIEDGHAAHRWPPTPTSAFIASNTARGRQSSCASYKCVWRTTSHSGPYSCSSSRAFVERTSITE